LGYPLASSLLGAVSAQIRNSRKPIFSVRVIDLHRALGSLLVKIGLYTFDLIPSQNFQFEHNLDQIVSKKLFIGVFKAN
jgi:hypothetical protein